VTGLGLKESKDLVEAAWPRTPQVVRAELTYEGRAIAAKCMAAGAYVRVVPHGARIDGAAVTSGAPSPLRRVVILRVEPGGQLLAIKAVREVTGFGLKDAKDTLDMVLRGTPMILASEVTAECADQLVALFRGAAELRIEQ